MKTQAGAATATLSRGDQKRLICSRVTMLTMHLPEAWQRWDHQKTIEFKEAVKACAPDNTLDRIVIAAKVIAMAYGTPPDVLIPAEALQ